MALLIFDTCRPFPPAFRAGGTDIAESSGKGSAFSAPAWAIGVNCQGAQTAPVASFTDSKFLRPNDLTIAGGGVRIEGSGQANDASLESQLAPRSSGTDLLHFCHRP